MGTFLAVLVRGINEAVHTLQQYPGRVEPKTRLKRHTQEEDIKEIAP